VLFIHVEKSLEEPLAKWFADRPLRPRTETYMLKSGTKLEKPLAK